MAAGSRGLIVRAIHHEVHEGHEAHESSNLDTQRELALRFGRWEFVGIWILGFGVFQRARRVALTEY